MSIAKVHHRFSVDDYERMIRSGILDENDNVELIQGEIIEKMAKGDPHCASVKKTNELFVFRFRGRATIGNQDPIRLGDSEPEPDITLLKFEADFYGSRKPLSQDVLLLIEVADSSLDFDRDIKLPIYAEAGIQEYWIVNLLEDKIEVYRDPQLAGRYATVLTFTRGQQIECLAFPGEAFEVAEIL
jgi:Uma2 family endonuclease